MEFDDLSFEIYPSDWNQKEFLERELGIAQKINLLHDCFSPIYEKTDLTHKCHFQEPSISAHHEVFHCQEH
jgi:hypothetical protein